MLFVAQLHQPQQAPAAALCKLHAQHCSASQTTKLTGDAALQVLP